MSGASVAQTMQVMFQPSNIAGWIWDVVIMRKKKFSRKTINANSTAVQVRSSFNVVRVPSMITCRMSALYVDGGDALRADFSCVLPYHWHKGGRQ